MPRYVTADAPGSEDLWWDRPNPITSVNVHDNVAIDTGLLDKHGRKIMRLPNEMGFHAKFD